MNIATLYLQAELAQAAYAIDLVPNASNINAFADKVCGMTQTQAATFAENFRVVDQYTAPAFVTLPGVGEVGGTGFSATVFQYIGENVGDLEYGQYVFAVRGTEPGNAVNDLLDADFANIGYEGFSLKQALDLYNYQKSLVTTYGESYQAVYLETDGLGKCSYSL